MSSPSVAVVVAAGAGRRLGVVAKAALLLPDGRSYLEAVRDAGQAAGVRDWLVVVGPPHEGRTRELADALGMTIVRNPRPERGMSSSVALGFQHASAHCGDAQVALLWPVDHPRVQPDSVRAVLAHARLDGAVIPTYGGRGGHPSAFGRAVWSDLSQCTELPEGARSVLRRLAEPDVAGESRVLRVAIDDPGVRLDVDTPSALAEVNGARPGSPVPVTSSPTGER